MHQRYKDKRSSRCKQCVRLRSDRKRAEEAALDAFLEAPRYYWDGYDPRCLQCSGRLYYDGEDVKCRDCGSLISTARQPVPLIRDAIRRLKASLA